MRYLDAKTIPEALIPFDILEDDRVSHDCRACSEMEISYLLINGPTTYSYPKQRRILR